ncbi:MAG: cysteine hydrolase family protein [Bacteroidota bacterium]
MNVRTTALLVIDVQEGIDHPKHGQRNNPHAEHRMADLLAAWRAHRGVIVHVQHASTRDDSPLRPDQPGFALKPEVEPQDGEPLYVKHANSAFIDTDLAAFLHASGITSVVVMGLTTDHCVSSSVRMASDLGFATYVVSDATATFERTDHTGRYFTAEDVHAVSLVNLHREFATILTAKQVFAALEEHTQVSAM